MLVCLPSWELRGPSNESRGKSRGHGRGKRINREGNMVQGRKLSAKDRQTLRELVDQLDKPDRKERP